MFGSTRIGHVASSLLALTCVVLATTGCGGDRDEAVFRGIIREPTPDVSGVSLPDVTNANADFEFRAQQGQLLIVYFGYTSCPDVCPTTLADVRVALDALDADDADRVDLAMATIDPERDNADVLTRYVQTFVPGSHALVSNDPEQLRAAADAFGADYEVVKGVSGEPEVSHTGFLYLVDDEGLLQVTWPFGVPAQDFVHDLELVFDQI